MNCGAFTSCDSCVSADCSWVVQSLSSWCTKEANGIVGEFSIVDGLDNLLCQFLPTKITTTTTGTALIHPTSTCQPEIADRPFSSGFYYGIGFWCAGLFLISWSIFFIICGINLCADEDNWSKRLARRSRSIFMSVWNRISIMCRRESTATNLRSQVNCSSNPAFFDALQDQRREMNELMEIDSLSSTLRRQRLFNPQPQPCLRQEQLEETQDAALMLNQEIADEGSNSFETMMRMQADSRLANAISALRANNTSPKKTRSGVKY